MVYHSVVLIQQKDMHRKNISPYMAYLISHGYYYIDHKMNFHYGIILSTNKRYARQ